MEWYEIDNISSLDTPALVVYPDRVSANIRLAVEMAGGPERLRPHVKTHKSPDAAKLLLEAGITKFKCATIAEAEMLAMAGAPDVLLAYQPSGVKAQRLVGLIKKYPATRFACLVDNIESAEEMSAVYAAAGVRVPVYLDLNVGMGRTGIVPGPEAHNLYRQLGEMEGIVPEGLHAYDGHLRDTDLAERKKKCDEAFAGVAALKELIDGAAGSGGGKQVAAGGDGPGEEAAASTGTRQGTVKIIAGGTPSFPIHVGRPEVECSPGTFIYWDKGYSEQLPEQAFLPAALVVSRVISVLEGGRLCLDLGHKSIAAENELGRRVFFLNGPDLQPVGQSEEHLVVQTHPAHDYEVGHIFYGLPYHICPTVALYERAFTIAAGKWQGEWKNSARDRIISV